MWNQKLINILGRYVLILCLVIKYIRTYHENIPTWKRLLKNFENKVDDIYEGSRIHQNAYSGKFFKYSLPRSEDKDEYEAYEDGKTELPRWLSFEYRKRKLHGVPTDEDIRSAVKIVFRRKHENTVNGLIGESKYIIINVYNNREPFTCEYSTEKNKNKYPQDGSPSGIITTGSIIFSANISKSIGRKRVRLLRKIAQQLQQPITSLYLELGNRLRNDVALENGIRMAGPGDRVTVNEPGFTVTWKIKCARDIAGDKNVFNLGELSAREDFSSTFKDPVLGWFVHTTEDGPFRYRRAIGAVGRTPVATPALGTPTMAVSPSPSVVVSPTVIKPSTSTSIMVTTSVVVIPPVIIVTSPTAPPVTTEKLSITIQVITTPPLTTAQPTTAQPTTDKPTISQTTTKQRITKQQTTSQPTTKQPTTKQPTIVQPTSSQLIIAQPTISQPSTEQPTTAQPTTEKPTTPQPTTEKPTTPQPTTVKPTTPQPTTEKPTTPQPTTEKPTTKQPTTEKPTTPQPTTEKPTTPQPTTEKPTTPQPTTEKPTTPQPTTERPTTKKPTTEQPTTEQPTTEKPTTEQPTTEQRTTKQSTTKDITIAVPLSPSVNQPISPVYIFEHSAREVHLSNTLFDYDKPLNIELEYSSDKDGKYEAYTKKNWIEYSNHKLYLLPKKEHIGTHKFALKGTDDDTGKYAMATFLVDVRDDTKLYNILFNITVSLSYLKVSQSAKLQVELIKGIAAASKRDDYQTLRAASLVQDGGIVWSLDETQYLGCRNIAVERYLSLIRSQDFRDAIKDAGVLEVGMVEKSPCKTVVPGAGETRADEGLWQRILIPVIVIVVLLLIIALILCCVYRRKRKANVQIEEDKAYLNHKKPVIFLEEFDEKPHFVSLQPLILPNEKPPRADTPEGPGSSTTVSTESEEKPLTSQSPKESRGKVYNAPPPYNSL